jgi:hypothetical protein
MSCSAVRRAERATPPLPKCPSNKDARSPPPVFHLCTGVRKSTRRFDTHERSPPNPLRRSALSLLRHTVRTRNRHRIRAESRADPHDRRPTPFGVSFAKLTACRLRRWASAFDSKTTHVPSSTKAPASACVSSLGAISRPQHLPREKRRRASHRASRQRIRPNLNYHNELHAVQPCYTLWPRTSASVTAGRSTKVNTGVRLSGEAVRTGQ